MRVTTDAASRRDCAPTAGYGGVLVAETTTERAVCAELDASWFSADGQGESGPLASPEELGTRLAELLLDEVRKGGVVDAQTQPLLLTLMALGPEDVSIVKLGALTKVSVERLRLLKTFLGVEFKLERQSDDTVRCVCQGSGYTNFARSVT